MSDDVTPEDAADAARAADVLLAESRIALDRAEARVSSVETKASWLLAGLVPSLGLVAVGVHRQAQGVDLGDALELAVVATGATVVALLLAATINVLGVLGLSDFQLIERAWLTGRIEAAERGDGDAATALTLGIAHGTMSAASSSADRANEKIRHFRPAMRLIRISVWAAVPYAITTIAQIARSSA